MNRTRSLLVFAWLVCLAGCQPAPEDDDGSSSSTSDSGDSGRDVTLSSSRQLTATEVLPVPETGIQLGWGYNQLDASPVPKQCVVFTPAEEPAQTRTMSMKEVTDTYELQQRMKVSAEASVKSMGVEGKGKASFAKNVNLSGSSIHFLLDASVDNGVRYAAPAAEFRNSAGRGPSIRLTDDAVRLAGKPDEFLRQCGTGFVSAVYSGASINAVISITTTSSSEKQDIRAEVQAKGWGATASGSMHQGTSTTASTNDRSMTVLMVGGRGDSIPKDQKELEAILETLSYSAYEAPKDFRMAVTPYESLSNWPQDKVLGEDSMELEQLAGLYGDYTTLYDEIEYILRHPELYTAIRAVETTTGEGEEATTSRSLTQAPLVSDEGGDKEMRYLETLQDYVQQSLRELEAFAIECLATEANLGDGKSCLFDETSYIESYAIRSQLPLMFPVTDSTPTTSSADCSDDSGAEKAICERAVKLNQLTAALAQEDGLDDLVAERWILSKSRSRCRLNITDIGCLSNAEARGFRARVGERLLLVPDDVEPPALASLTLDRHSTTWLMPERYDDIVQQLQSTNGTDD